MICVECRQTNARKVQEMQITIDQESESIECGYNNYMSEVIIEDYFCTRYLDLINIIYSYRTYSPILSYFNVSFEICRFIVSLWHIITFTEYLCRIFVDTRPYTFSFNSFVINSNIHVEDSTLNYQIMAKFIYQIYMEDFIFGNLNIWQYYCYSSIQFLCGIFVRTSSIYLQIFNGIFHVTFMTTLVIVQMKIILFCHCFPCLM